jgi:hypothetical protein
MLKRYKQLTEKNMKTVLSDQALMCVMMALQKSLMEQSDIVPVLKSFEFVEQPLLDGTVELSVINPPTQINVPAQKFVTE